ncbi:MAG: 2-hydroxychromene-2-carboxylate isomerase [Gammaproteobacteria bacterium]|nr:2-hydroxychromene-2-carboxylate isomerase [Gammaproteobacteria bacterium]
MPQLEFFFDCSSPWTYLGFVGIQPIAKRLGIEIQWRPILVGGVFNAVNPELYAAREKIFQNEQRIAHMMKDLSDWADYRGISIIWPGFHLQVTAVQMMRACLVAQEQGRVVEFAALVFEHYWSKEQDISSVGSLRAVAEAIGLDGDGFVERLQSPDIKAQLRNNTEDLVARGGYGSPTLFINGDDMYFGNDRLPIIERKLQQLVAA